MRANACSSARIAITATNAAAIGSSNCLRSKRAKENPHDAAIKRPRADETIRRPQRLQERQLRSVSGRSAVYRRRIRLGQDHAAEYARVENRSRWRLAPLHGHTW